MLKPTIRIICFVLSLSLTAAPASRAAEQPLDIAKSVIERALEILRNQDLSKQERRRQVKEIVDRRFDYREMAKRSLGATWRTLSKAQQDDFVRLFAELLEASYSDKIEKYAVNVRVDYVGQSVDGDYAEVRTLVIRPNDKIPISYRLLNESGGWMVYDVTIEGVSLVSNYRSQFSQIIHESSYGELVRRLRTKVHELQATGGA
jgi:phospholipid transport system substrate-binding protein